MARWEDHGGSSTRTARHGTSAVSPAQQFTLIDPTTRAVVRQIPSSGTVATVVAGASAQRDDIDGIPCVCYGRPEKVEGIPLHDEGPVIVAAQVASAMAELGMTYSGAAVAWTKAHGVTPVVSIGASASHTTGERLSDDERGHRLTGYHEWRVTIAGVSYPLGSASWAAAHGERDDRACP